MGKEQILSILSQSSPRISCRTNQQVSIPFFHQVESKMLEPWWAEIVMTTKENATDCH